MDKETDKVHGQFVSLSHEQHDRTIKLWDSRQAKPLHVLKFKEKDKEAVTQIEVMPHFYRPYSKNS